MDTVCCILDKKDRNLHANWMAGGAARSAHSVRVNFPGTGLRLIANEVYLTTINVLFGSRAGAVLRTHVTRWKYQITWALFWNRWRMYDILR
jgi:hypothetical protein